MNVKILSKISKRVRLVKDDNYYYVETRPELKDEWTISPSFSSIKRALRRKHNAMQLTIRNIGYFTWFKERRVKKFNRFRRKYFDENGKKKFKHPSYKK